MLFLRDIPVYRSVYAEESHNSDKDIFIANEFREAYGYTDPVTSQMRTLAQSSCAFAVLEEVMCLGRISVAQLAFLQGIRVSEVS